MRKPVSQCLVFGRDVFLISSADTLEAISTKEAMENGAIKRKYSINLPRSNQNACCIQLNVMLIKKPALLAVQERKYSGYS